MHKCEHCADLTRDKVFTEIDQMYKPTFDHLCTLSSYPKYFESIKKRLMSCIGKGTIPKPCIAVDHLIAWCEDESLASELTVDIQLDQDEIHHHESSGNEQNKQDICLNPRCVQTRKVRQQKLREVITELGKRKHGFLYQEDFNALIRRIHECDTCRCPKTVLSLAKVLVLKKYIYSTFIKQNIYY